MWPAAANQLPACSQPLVSGRVGRESMRRQQQRSVCGPVQQPLPVAADGSPAHSDALQPARRPHRSARRPQRPARRRWPGRRPAEGVHVVVGGLAGESGRRRAHARTQRHRARAQLRDGGRPATAGEVLVLEQVSRGARVRRWPTRVTGVRAVVGGRAVARRCDEHFDGRSSYFVAI